MSERVLCSISGSYKVATNGHLFMAVINIAIEKFSLLGSFAKVVVVGSPRGEGLRKL